MAVHADPPVLRDVGLHQRFAAALKRQAAARVVAPNAQRRALQHLFQHGQVSRIKCVFHSQRHVRADGRVFLHLFTHPHEAGRKAADARALLCARAGSREREQQRQKSEYFVFHLVLLRSRRFSGLFSSRRTQKIIRRARPVRLPKRRPRPARRYPAPSRPRPHPPFSPRA